VTLMKYPAMVKPPASHPFSMNTTDGSHPKQCAMTANCQKSMA
jgi:hypothetical protein